MNRVHSFMGTKTLATLILTTLLLARSANAADPDWEIVAAPTPDGSECDLHDIDVVSAHEAWAVGIQQDSNTGENRTLILHYINESWTVVPSPNPTSSCVDGNVLWSGNSLIAVDVRAADDIWAVGQGCYGWTTLIEHWNGTDWQLVPSPNPLPDGSNVLTGVSASSASDAWAVGYTSGSIGAGALIEHWNGTQWSVVPSPGTGGYLSSVVALSPSDAWAVGGYYDDLHQRSNTLILHWNGVSWNVVPSPSPGSPGNSLSNLMALGPNDAWAVGSSSAGGAIVTLALHWDGHTWQVVPSPNFETSSSASNSLRSVTAISPDNIWAAGMYRNQSTDNQQPRTLVMHWDGSAWTLTSSPSPGRSSEVNSIVLGPYEESWCVGRYSEVPVDLYDGHYTGLRPLMMEALLKQGGAAASVPGAPGREVSLGLPSPNPARGGTSLAVHVSAPSRVTVAVHDVRGRLVRTILAGEMGPGDYRAAWNGVDAHQHACDPGLYFATLEVGGRRVESRTITLVR